MKSIHKISLSYKTAFFLALGISLLINILFIIMFIYGRESVMPPGGDRIRPSLKIHITLLYVLFNFSTAYILYLINFFLLNKNYLPHRNWMIIISTVVVATVVWSLFLSVIQIALMHGPPPLPMMWGGLLRDSFIAVVVTLSSQLLYVSRKQQQTLLENETLMLENMRSRFHALKSQVDPHFLFNSLNTLNSLIAIDREKAQEYVQQLSNVFRYTLQNKTEITLEEELKFNSSYCHLMQIRYGDNLHIVYNIDEQYHQYLIIPFSIQTLVENVIKHNVVSNKLPLTVTIATSDKACLSVSNPVQPKKEAERGEGIGLINLRERYHLMWKEDIVVNQTDDLFEVLIPLIKKDS
ncbi:MAG: histidine kinase [Bacteroidales bacterium]|nr:histidine kinase [Bacteroidales bacterium]